VTSALDKSCNRDNFIFRRDLQKLRHGGLPAGTIFRLKYQDSNRRTAPPTFTPSTAGPLVAIYNKLPMRTLVIIFSFIFTINLKVYTQIFDTNNVIIDNFQEMPNFPGGPDSVWCFLESNFKYDILNADQKMVSYLVTFVVDSSGVVRDIKFISTRPRDIINDHADSLKRIEILRVLALMPKWEPARQFNKKINFRIAISIKSPYTEFRCMQKKKIKTTATNTDNMGKLFPAFF
jgi:hypothetical protein